MANQITQTLLDNAVKSLVAYGTLKSHMKPKDIIEELTRTDFFADVEFSKEEAMAFAGIVEKADDAGNTFYDFQTDDNENRTTGHTVLTSSQELGIGYESGFDAVILKDNATGEISFNVAGTHITSPLDMISNELLAATGYTPQETAMENFYKMAVATGAISADDKLVMNGHSKGGYLTAKFTQDHPDVVEKAYTFNGAGIGGFTNDIQQLLGADFSSLINDKIINVAADGEFSIIEDLGVNPGTPDVEVGSGNSHSILNIIDALRNNQITPEGANILAEVYLRDNGLPVNSASIAAISSTITNNESIIKARKTMMASRCLKRLVNTQFKKVLFPLLGLAFCIPVVFAETTFYEAGFDCNKITEADKIEWMICTDEELAQLDKHLNRFYQLVISNELFSESWIAENQQTWLKKRNTNCFQYVNCLDVYEEQLLALGEMIFETKDIDLKEYIYGKLQATYSHENSTFELYSKFITMDIHQYCTLIKRVNGEREWMIEFYDKEINYRCGSIIVSNGDLYIYGSQQKRELGDFAPAWIAKIDMQNGVYMEKRWYVFSDNHIINILPTDNDKLLVAVHSKEYFSYTTFFIIDGFLNTYKQKQYKDTYPDIDTLKINGNSVSFLDRFYKKKYQFNIKPIDINIKSD